MKNKDRFFYIASEIIESDNLICFYFLSDGARADDNKYSEIPETATELIACTIVYRKITL